MKKFISVAFALVLALSLSVSAFAAGSQSGAVGTTTAGVTAAVSGDQAVTGEVSGTNLAKTLTKAGVTASNPTLVEVLDLSGTVPADGKVVLTNLSIPTGKDVVVLHMPTGTTTWQKEACTWDGTTLTITGLTTFSPFAILTVDKAAATTATTKTIGKINATWSDGGVVADLGGGVLQIVPNAGYAVKDVVVDGTSVGAVTSYTFTTLDQDHTMMVYFTKTGATTASGTSPKTGEHNFVALAAGLVAIAGFGAVAAARKKHE